MAPPSTELRLIVECCRRSFGAGDDRLGSLAAQADWERFARLARFHRVQGLVWHGLREGGADLPDPIAGPLADEARQIAATNLRIAAEARELRTAFAQAGLRILFVKGLTVGALAYPTPTLKMGWDIDILVDQAALPEVAALLMTRGYSRTVPPPRSDLRTWHARRKESVWTRPEERLYVELHTRLVDNRRLVPAIGLDSPVREVEVIAGVSLPTLAADELFAYLCVHGASSLWFRLKWITDLAALLASCPPGEIERLYARSQELGAARAADQALLLADHLYGTLQGSDLGARLARDGASRRLAYAALRQVVDNRDGREPTDSLLGTLPIHWTQLLLRPGLRFATGEAARQVAHALA